MEGDKKDRIRPLASWFIFVKGGFREVMPPTAQKPEVGEREEN